MKADINLDNIDTDDLYEAIANEMELDEIVNLFRERDIQDMIDNLAEEYGWVRPIE